MKKTLLLLLFTFVVSLTFAQEFKKPAEGKALVYFVRFSGTGALINFKYFDGETYLGKMNGVHYFLGINLTIRTFVKVRIVKLSITS